jgi:HK97 family phage prohead protease
METRYFKTTTRAEGDGDFPTEVGGIGAVVGVTTDLGYCEEEIAVGAFDECDMSDVLVCFNHDMDTILGRTVAQTATVGISDKGDLVYSANKLDKDNPEVVPAVRYIMRGEVSKSSFMFEIGEQIWNDSAIYGSGMKRTITKVSKLYECGPVTLPAYSETESYARQKSELMECRNKWLQSNETPTDHLIDDEAEKRAYWQFLYELTIK